MFYFFLIICYRYSNNMGWLRGSEELNTNQFSQVTLTKLLSTFITLPQAPKQEFPSWYRLEILVPIRGVICKEFGSSVFHVIAAFRNPWGFEFITRTLQQIGCRDEDGAKARTGALARIEVPETCANLDWEVALWSSGSTFINKVQICFSHSW